MMIALMQLFIRYGLLIPLGVDISLSDFDFLLLVLATIFLAAAGNIINDIYDVVIDAINKPSKVIIGRKITEKNAYSLFIILNCIGVAIGFYLSNRIDRPIFSALFIIISVLLYLYASQFKSILLAGNIIISLLVALSLIIIGLFDLLPSINNINQEGQFIAFRIILDYSLFAFFINLIREIVKDIQDIDGDKNGGMNTLPIVLGRKRASYIAFSLGIIALFSIVYYIYIYLYHIQIMVIYFLICIVAPLVYFCVKAWDATTKSDYAFLSKLLKIIMFLGMCSILLYSIVI